MVNITKIFFLLSVILTFTACGELKNELQANPTPEPDTQSGEALELKLNNIEPMIGQHYEGWAITTNGVLTTGRFNVDSNGEVFSVNSEGHKIDTIGVNNIAKITPPAKKEEISRFILTIEPDGDTDDGASSVHYVDGSFVDGKAIAKIDNSGAIGASFLNSIGTFILATPTNGPTTHNQGIWFLDSGNASLELPSLNNGWAYEGWIVNKSTGEVVSTGTFNSATGVDSDDAGPTAGPNPGQPFPGQDFITPPMVLNDGNHVTVISVEPQPDFDPSPFTLKILAHEIANGAPVTTNIPLNNISNEADISIELEFK